MFLIETMNPMKKIFFAAVALCAMSACSSPSNIEKANDSMEAFAPHLMPITQIDSVMGYPDAYDHLVKAAQLTTQADTVVRRSMRKMIALKNEDKKSEMYKLAFETRTEASELMEQATTERSTALRLLLEGGKTGKEKQFVGFRSTNKTDSCIYTTFFDRNLNVLAIDKRTTLLRRTVGSVKH